MSGQQPKSLSADQAIQLGYQHCFHSWGKTMIGRACFNCRRPLEDGEGWVANFGLRVVGLDILWFSIQHCRDCDPWKSAEGVAERLDGSLVAGPASSGWNAVQGK